MEKYSKYQKSTIAQIKLSIQRLIFLSRIRNNKFCIVSNYCWGAKIYQELGYQYNTPFVDLFLFSPCYIHLLSNFKRLIVQNLKFIDKSRYNFVDIFKTERNYPIGVLGDEVEIHFLHYSSKEEAEVKWKRRRERMNFEHLFFAYSDRDLFNNELLNKFLYIPVENKVFFTARKELKSPFSVWISECEGQPDVGDLYTQSYLVHRHFDVISWLNGTTDKFSPIYLLLNRMLEV